MLSFQLLKDVTIVHRRVFAFTYTGRLKKNAFTNFAKWLVKKNHLLPHVYCSCLCVLTKYMCGNSTNWEVENIISNALVLLSIMCPYEIHGSPIHIDPLNFLYTQ